jgi:hypothetical protein
MEGLDKLYTGDFNIMRQRPQPDGSVIVTLSSSKYPEVYRFRVKDLYGEHEEVLEHEIITPRQPKWLSDRMKEAREHEVM